MPNKRFTSLFLCMILFLSGGDYAASANTALSAEKMFSEDFESYHILDNDNNTAYYTNNAQSVNDIINCGKPADGDYSDTAVYPYGSASVYEGNADNYQMYVKDAKGNKIYGGLDGWYGYYNGGGQQYNRWNRRLSVVKKTSNSNKTQFLNMQPVNNSYITGAKAIFCRNNIELKGYSYLTARLSFNSGENVFNKSGIAVTVNPDKQTYENSFDAVYFTDSETEGNLDVYFGETKMCEVTKSEGGKWYTIEYRIYNSGVSAKHRLKIIDDESNTCLFNAVWQDVIIDAEAFSAANEYGLMFYANAGENGTPVMMVDDIRFENSGFSEDFESYSVSKHYNSSNGFLSNGAKGNTNLELYANGTFEGNMALNNYVLRTLDSSTTGRVYGNVPFWQGYVSRVISGINMYTTDKWKDACTVISSDDRYEAKAAGFKKALILYPRTTDTVTEAQSVYAGMECVDISEKTTLKTSVNLYNEDTQDDMFKIQLTNGRSTAKDYSEDATSEQLSYDGNSFNAYFDILKFESGLIYFEDENIGKYSNKVTYVTEYTVDTEESSHSVKVYRKSDGALIAEGEEKLPEDMSGFSFEGIVGFRYIASTPSGTSQDKKENKVLLDDVSITKELPGYVTGVPENMTLTVDTSNVIKNVSRQTYGINFEWGGEPERYLLENTTEINPLFTERFKNNIPIARMAGVSANWMLWKEAIGDISERGDLYFWHYDARPQNYGPVEWIKSVKESDPDAKLVYTVNMPRSKPTDERILGLIGNKTDQIDTVENLKDLVRFMTLEPDDPNAIGSDGINWAQKRVDLGITEPVEIYAWELGCELDTDAQGWYRVAEYIEMCKTAIAAIREIDPDAKISAHEKTSIFYDDSITREWHNKLLNTIGSDIDYLSVHYYYMPETWNAFENYLNTLQQDIALTPAKDKIKILLTEHSSARYSSDVSAGYDYNLPHTMRGTLTTAEFFTKFMCRTEIEAAMYHSIQSSSWALMYEEDGKYQKTGPGYVLELFGQNGVGKSVSCTLSEYDNACRELKVSAGAVKTEKGLNLFLVNTSNDSDTTLKLDLGGNYRMVKQTVITADAYESDKYTGVDEIVCITEEKDSVTDTYKLNARSIVLLEFADNAQILRADKNSGSVEYELNSINPKTCNVICAAYKDNNFVNVKIVPVQSAEGSVIGTLNMGNYLLDSDMLKLFVWDFDTLYPICIADEYIIK